MEITPIKGSVILSNNQVLSVEGKGSIKIQTLVDNVCLEGTINNVLYVPELRKNLFSEGVVTTVTSSKNMSIVKQGSTAKIFKNNVLVAEATRDLNNLYKMLFRTIVCSVNAVRPGCSVVG